MITSQIALYIIGILSFYSKLNHASTVPANKVECGKKPTTVYSTKRIVGGEETVAGEWPWMVALFHNPKTPGSKPYFKCGATLISDKWIVTAGHCASALPQSYIVRLGEHDLNVKDSFEQDIPISRVIINPSFGIGVKVHNGTKKLAMYAEHDIALMELKTPAKLDSRTFPVCVDYGVNNFIAGKDCYITGWGNKALKAPSPEPRLLHVVVPLVSKGKCNHDKSYGGLITDNMVCAGFEKGGKDTCLGDSGGPLMCEGGGKWYIHGVSSFGHNACAIAYKYGVYTRVSQFKNWIQKTTNIDCNH